MYAPEPCTDGEEAQKAMQAGQFEAAEQILATGLVVSPDDSGLSYNEAWDFTKGILSQYDYYYIDGWPGEGGQD